MGRFLARKTQFKRAWYDSNHERDCAIWLDSLKSRGIITEIEREPRLSLDVNGQHIATHYPDFLITLPDGRQKIVEAKGFPSEAWPLKRKLTEALYPQYQYLIYWQGRNKKPLTEQDVAS